MRYIPHTKEDIRGMLGAIGIRDVDELFNTIPSEYRLSSALNLPDGLDEPTLIIELQKMAQANRGSADNMALFLGAGAYHHHIPAAVDQLLLRGEFFTAYTPYQPEASQGTLQAIFEYQSIMAALTGCEVVNASMYDGATATAEALLMAGRLKKKRPRCLLPRTVHPEVRDVCATYLSDADLVIEQVAYGEFGQTDLDALAGSLSDDVAAVVIQQPNFFGCLEDLPKIIEMTHQAGALLIAVVLEPVSLGLLEAPGVIGADIVTGEAMGLGTGLNFGGPGLGLFATSMKNAWHMPGRLVGQTTDQDGKRGFVLTMSTREQHIRRARATSNICTNEGLCALAAAIYLSLMGEGGFKKLAGINAANAQETRKRLGRVKGVEPRFDAPFFNEFVVKLNQDVDQALDKLKARGVLGGLPLGRYYPELADCLLVCVTETNNSEQVDRFASGLEG